MPDQITDHDVLTTLVANVNNLAKGQDEFRKEVKESIDDLKNNYSNRIQGIEDFKNNADKVFAAKHDQDLVNDDLFKQVNSLKQWRSYTAGALAVVTVIVLPIVAWLAVSVINHIADDKANQVTVQQIQNTYNGLNQTISTLQTEIQNHINANAK